MPSVSVVIPTCNRPDLLPRAIRSVLAQTFQDFEIIIVDDGDGESAESVVKSFSEGNIRYIKNDPPKQGGGATRNRGIAESTGEYVAFLDDDDEWMPLKLSVQMEAFAPLSKSVAFCFSALTQEYPDYEYTTTVEDGVRDFSEIALSRFKGFITSTLIIRKSVLEEVGGFDASLPSHQEPELIIRITRTYQGVGVNQPLVRMNMSPREHIGGNLDRRVRGRLMLLEKHASLFATRTKVLAMHYFQIGLWLRATGRGGEATKHFFHAFRLTWNVRYLLHGIVALLRT